MAWAIRQAKATAADSASSITVTFDSPTAAGSLILAFCWSYYPSARFPTAFGATGDAGVLHGTPDAEDKYWIGYVADSVGGKSAYKFTLNGSNAFNRALAIEITGHDTAAPIADAVIAAIATYATTTDGISQTVTVPAGGLVIGAAFQGNNTNVPVHGTGFSDIISFTSGDGDAQYAEYATGLSGSTAVTMTLGTGESLDFTAVALKPAASTLPEIDSISSDDVVTSDETGAAVVGTNLGATNADRTFKLVQGSVSVDQTETGTGTATAATLSIVTHDSGSGKDLKFGAATLEVTVGSNSATLDATLDPPSGQLYVDLTSVNGTADNRITASPDLAAGDQLQASGGGSSGSSAAPAGLTLNADGTFTFGDTPTAFDVRAWDSSDQTWGAWATQDVGSLTGTASITESADAASGTGSLSTSGAGTLSEGADVAAASGTLSASGSASIEEGADVAAGSGTVGGVVGGEAEIVEPADSASGAGALSASGAATIDESADVASGAGDLSVLGSATIAEGADVASGSGSAEQQGISGAAAINEGADVASGAGAVSVPGSAAISEGADVASGTGGVFGGVLVGDPRYVVRRVSVRNFTVRRTLTRNFTVNSMSSRFPVKGPNERVPVIFDFAPDLPAGVTLSGVPTFAVEVREGVDPDPSAIMSGAAGFDASSKQVILPLVGGLDGCEYAIFCDCPTTQSNLKLTLVGILPVRKYLN